MLSGFQSRTRLSTLGSVVLCLGIGFMLSLLFAGAGYMAVQQQREWLADYASNSTTASGVVTRKYREIKYGNTLAWDLEVSFTAADGSTPKMSFRIPVAVYDRYNPGSSVPVTYVKSKPYLFYIPGAEPDPANIVMMQAMDKWCIVAAILFGTGFLVSCLGLMWRGSDAGYVPPPPSRVTVGRIASVSRGTFGTRQ